MFDCFFTDPPYTVEGMSLFLSRGIGGLKKERGLKVFLSFGQKPVEDVFRVQEAILAHGLILLEQFKAFNEYEGASLLGNISQMMVLESTDHVRGGHSSHSGVPGEDLYSGVSRSGFNVLLPGLQGDPPHGKG